MQKRVKNKKCHEISYQSLINVKRHRKILLKELITSKHLPVQSQQSIKTPQKFVKCVQSKE